MCHTEQPRPLLAYLPAGHIIQFCATCPTTTTISCWDHFYWDSLFIATCSAYSCTQLWPALYICIFFIILACWLLCLDTHYHHNIISTTLLALPPLPHSAYKLGMQSYAHYLTFPHRPAAPSIPMRQDSITCLPLDLPTIQHPLLVY